MCTTHNTYHKLSAQQQFKYLFWSRGRRWLFAKYLFRKRYQKRIGFSLILMVMINHFLFPFYKTNLLCTYMYVRTKVWYGTDEATNQTRKLRVRVCMIKLIMWFHFLGKLIFSTLHKNKFSTKRNKKQVIRFKWIQVRCSK